MIHVGLFQCVKVRMMWVDAVARFHFQRNFVGQESDPGQLLRYCLFLMKPIFLSLNSSITNKAFTEQVYLLH